MSVGWSVRVECEFTFERLRLVTRETLCDLLELDEPGLEIGTNVSTFQYARALLEQAESAPPAQMNEVHGPHSRESGHVVFVLDEIAAGVGIFVTIVPLEDSDVDDYDSGVHCGVSPDRNAGSYVLALATLIAAARVAGGLILDDSGLLGGSRLVEVDALVNQLKSGGPYSSLTDAVNGVLEYTKLRARM